MSVFGRVAMSAMRWIVVASMTLMVALVFGNVVLRYGFNSGISVSEELARYLFVWMTFVGAVVAMQQRGHLGVDSLVERLPRKGKIVCAVIGDLLMLGCCALLLVGSWKQALINMENQAPVSGLPVGWMHAAAVVCSVGLLVIIGAHLLRLLTGRAIDADLAQVMQAEAHAPEPAAEQQTAQGQRK